MSKKNLFFHAWSIALYRVQNLVNLSKLVNLIDQKLWIYQKLYPPKDDVIELSVKFIHYSIEFIETLHSSKDTINLRAGTKAFTYGKWFIGYNFGIDRMALNQNLAPTMNSSFLTI